MENPLKLYKMLAVSVALPAKVRMFDGCVQAGFPSPAADYVENSIDLDKLLIKNPAATFLIKVEGESMIDAFIPPKALIVVDRSLTAYSGDIVVAVVNGEFTVKRLLKTQVGIFLSPANSRYKPIRLTDDMDFKLWGVVSKIIIDPKDI